MKKGILAIKVGMTQIFNDNGELVPVTVLQAGPCAVTQVKTVDNDGYDAVQVGFVDKRNKLVSKPQKGHFEKAGVSYKRYVREFRFENAAEYKLADEIKADIFAEGDRVAHVTFGEGEILSAKKLGADTLYEVAFDNAGTKKLMASFAKLKKI